MYSLIYPFPEFYKFVHLSFLYSIRSGFRSHYSTDMCLIYLLDHIGGNNWFESYLNMMIILFSHKDTNIILNKVGNVL